MQRALSGIVTLLITTACLCNTAFAESGKPDNNFIIEAYGGSSTRGAMAIKENGKLRAIYIKDNEIALINQWLQEKYGDGIRVVNKGASSSQAMDLLNGKYFYKNNKSWREEMKKSPAKIILLNFATNDARHFHFRDIEKDYQVSPDKYTQVMTQLITIAREEGKQVILQEPHPICGRAEKWHVAPYVTKLDALAEAESVPLARQYQRILQMKDWQSLMSPDCIHPSEQLYRMKAEETFSVLVSHFNTELAAAGHGKNPDGEQVAKR
ncbi:SGNH/GDSL hydrolase family protein [Pantoea dispersa]|uniref:SGNH/GDSL hydrolase family protein n=1 Tax=Pantoea dispersa TaxID=59814 RepID=UPI00092F33D9|nr:SGNH/GDSL hydrolase family protein [Pantoea dispersa]